MLRVDRRTFLTGLGAISFAFPGRTFASDRSAYVSCCQKPDGSYAAAIINDALEIVHVEPLDSRGHDAAVSPDGRYAVVFARRPGWFAVVLDLKRRARVMAFSPPAGRHFYGHGCFSEDGRLLFATENDFEEERGEIGIYDATDSFNRIGFFATGGIGPHEVLLLSDGRTLAVANGGIATHPDYPRQKLNLFEMEPSIALIDSLSGGLIEMATLPSALRQLSIRHMVEVGDGSLWFGGQYEGPETDEVPLVGLYKRDEGLSLIDAPSGLYNSMNQYIGSVAVSNDGERVATTSPRGGLALIWDAKNRNVIEPRPIADVCGVAAAGNSFLFSDGSGSLTGEDQLMRQQSVSSWDNHLTYA